MYCKDIDALSYSGEELAEYLEGLAASSSKIGHLDFVAIDFETATHNYNSACSVGLAFVKDLAVVKSAHFLIRPPRNYYEEQNIMIHGIHPSDTENAPDFLAVWTSIYPYIKGTALVAHNAKFDMQVLKESLNTTNEYIPEHLNLFKYVDTISMAKEFVPGKKNLVACTDHLNISLSNHHNAECDAIACAEIAIACIKLAGFRDLGSFCFSRPHIHIREVQDVNEKNPWSHTKRPSCTSKTIVPIKTDFDCAHPFYGKNIVFTGELSIERSEAAQLVVNVGAFVKSSVSGKTDYLVVGVQDNDVVGEDGLSTKEEKAYELLRKGKSHIQIIKEKEFFDLLKGRTV